MQKYHYNFITLWYRCWILTSWNIDNEEFPISVSRFIESIQFCLINYNFIAYEDSLDWLKSYLSNRMQYVVYKQTNKCTLQDNFLMQFVILIFIFPLGLLVRLFICFAVQVLWIFFVWTKLFDWLIEWLIDNRNNNNNNDRLLSIAANAGWHRKYNPACWIKQYACSTNCTKAVSEMLKIGLYRESALQDKSSTCLFISSIRQNTTNYYNYTIIYLWFLIRGGVRGLRFVTYFRSWGFRDMWQWHERGRSKWPFWGLLSWRGFCTVSPVCRGANDRTVSFSALATSYSYNSVVISCIFFKPFRSHSVKSL